MFKYQPINISSRTELLLLLLVGFSVALFIIGSIFALLVFNTVTLILFGKDVVNNAFNQSFNKLFDF